MFNVQNLSEAGAYYYCPARVAREKTFQCVSHLLPCTNSDEGTGSMEQMDNEDAGDMENIDKMDSTQLKEKVKLTSDRGDSHKNLRSCKIQSRPYAQLL